MTLYRKDTRLPRENYLGRKCYFITICCDLRQAHLAEHRIADRVLRLLKECAAKRSFVLHAFCLMPDHMHLLTEGCEPRSDLVELIRIFKLWTSFEFRRSQGQALWETSYYDHILRPADRIEDVACYIWWNPVRKGLCERPQDYAYSGSQTIAWMQRAEAGSSWRAPWKLKADAAGV